MVTDDSKLDDRHAIACKVVLPKDSDRITPDVATGTTIGVHNSEDPLVPWLLS